MKSERLNLQLQEAFREVAKQFLAECPNRVDGINIARVESFLAQKGLTLTPYKFAFVEDFEAIAEKLPNEFKLFLINWLKTVKTRENRAAFWSPVGVSLIPRDIAQEGAGGTVQVEALLVHESAGHGSSTAATQIIDVEGENGAVRNGFGVVARKRNVVGWGKWLEEAFAARLQAQYKAFCSEEQRKKELSEFLETEINEESTIAFNFTGDEWNYPIMLPAAYLDVEFLGYDATQQKVLGVNQPHTAGFTLDLLIQNDPTLEQLLIESRANPILLREVASRLESIDKGLYSFLQRRTFPEEGLDFHECAVKFWRIINLLYGGDLTKIFQGSSKLYDRLETVIADSKK